MNVIISTTSVCPPDSFLPPAGESYTAGRPCSGLDATFTTGSLKIHESPLDGKQTRLTLRPAFSHGPHGLAVGQISYFLYMVGQRDKRG